MSDIHRLLDEAFLGVTMTPDLQDLKEELRGNLGARADELQARGMDAATAASTAVAELDLPELIAGVERDESGARTPGGAAADAARLHRVRPKPGFVILATLLAILVAASAVVVVLAAAHVLGDVATVGLVAALILGLSVAALVDASVRQETAQRYRMPNARAIGFGLAAGALSLGLATGGLLLGWILWSPAAVAVAPGTLVAPGVVLAVAAILVLAGVIAFIALGVTQTNRLKPWAIAQANSYLVEDRFSQDPAAAARFGMYTVVIWIAAIALFVVLSIVVGFVWSWLALVAGLLVFFLVLSRMLFAPQSTSEKK